MNDQAPQQPTNLNDFIRDNLNEQQRLAVTHHLGPVLVVAGAGSGKTRVITARIAHLMINNGCNASNIVALTFTNKAAQEMRTRIASFLPDGTAVPFIGTFHGYCLRILKQRAALLEQPFAAILDADDARMIIEGIIKRNGLQKVTSAKSIQHQISLYKNQLMTPTTQVTETRHDPLFVQIYAAYEQEKTTNKCLDFDDLLVQALGLFKKNDQFRKEFQTRVRHILVDEYQDTNVVQHELLQYMTKNQDGLALDSVCAVGDEDQSIYSWRGATVRNIIHFNKDFPNTTVIKVEQNYRSNQHILDTANALIAHNTQRTPKKLWSAKKGQGRIRTITCSSEYQEADALAALFTCASRISRKKSHAILYRAHFQSRVIEEALIKHSLPYTIIGGIQFYERKEIKDLLAYLRLVCNPADRISFIRAIQCPPRGLGDKFIEQFHEQWAQTPQDSFSAIAQRMISQNIISGVRSMALQQFIQIFASLTPESIPHSAVEHIVQTTHYITYLQKNHDTIEAKERIENIQELLRALKHLHQQGTATIATFLDEVALMQEKHDAHAQDHNPIYLMTLHAAKGLEFDLVALAGLEEGILPSTRSTGENDTLEEERRLLYVGITRAQEYLLLSHSRNRYTYGSISPQKISRFLEEIPKDLLHMHAVTAMNYRDMHTFFNEWLTRAQSVVTAPIMTFGSHSITKEPSQPCAAVAPTHTGVGLTKKTTSYNTWKRNQLVRHATFGIGMITDIDPRVGNDGPYITVRFKTNTKKIAARFLKSNE